MGTSHDITEIEVQDSGHWELAAAAARLERALLARRLHNGPMQDIAATILELQVLAGRADASSQAGLEDAVAVLIEQQRSIREMVEDMLGRETSRALTVAVVLEALAMQQREVGRKVTWTVTPADATLTAANELPFRLKLLGSIPAGAPDALAIEIRASETLEVTVAGAGFPTVQFSMRNEEAPA